MTYLLSEEDISTALHPNLWREICDQLGYGPSHGDDDYPSMIQVRAVRYKRTEE